MSVEGKHGGEQARCVVFRGRAWWRQGGTASTAEPAREPVAARAVGKRLLEPPSLPNVYHPVPWARHPNHTFRFSVSMSLQLKLLVVFHEPVPVTPPDTSACCPPSAWFSLIFSLPENAQQSLEFMFTWPTSNPLCCIAGTRSPAHKLYVTFPFNSGSMHSESPLNSARPLVVCEIRQFQKSS